MSTSKPLDFGVIYVGNMIDGEQIGFDGPKPQDRFYDNDRLSGVFQESLNIAELMESLGAYNVLWFAEHHYQREGFEVISNIPMLSLWLANKVKNLQFGCGFNVLPTWNPIRLAEDFATVDILTEGRLIFGVGRGYHEREIVAMNTIMSSLNADERREYFEEQVEIIYRAFTEKEFNHQGKYFQLPPAGAQHQGIPVKTLTLVPKPRHDEVDIWQPTTSGNPRGLDFMARYGIKGMLAGLPKKVTFSIAKQFQEANERAGRSLALGERMALGLRCYIADTEQEAKDRLRVIFDEYSKFAAPLGVFPYTEELIEYSQQNGLPVPENPMITTFEETLESGAWFAGTAEQLVAEIEGILEELPALEHILINLHIPASHEENRELIRRFAEDVIPNIQRRNA